MKATTPPSAAQASSRRADAERNRDKILAAARSAFEESGSDVSMAEISRRAGVGMATIYRNFADRRGLLEALYRGEVQVICDAAENAPGEMPGPRLEDWLRHCMTFALNKRAFAADLLAHVDGDETMFDTSRARVIASGRPLLIAAQHAQEVRGDLSLEQILDTIVAIAAIRGDARYRQPILATFLDGLRAPTRRV
jgi:AcrR family transcriptional regulator